MFFTILLIGAYLLGLVGVALLCWPERQITPRIKALLSILWPLVVAWMLWLSLQSRHRTRKWRRRQRAF